jgi:hypothetical protein
MPEESERVLNLDELYGTSRPVIVVWQGKRYQLRRPEAMGPIEVQGFIALQTRYQETEARRERFIAGLKPGEEPTQKQKYDDEKLAREISQLLLDVLRQLSAELADAGLPFPAQLAVLKFWQDEVAPSPNPPTPQSSQ